MKKVISLVAALVLCVAVLTACGDSAANGNVDRATLEEGKLIAGTNAAFPPFEYLGDDGVPTGFDIALIKAIGEKLGLEVEVQDMEFNALVAAVGNKVDVAIAGMTVDGERAQTVDFSDPYYEAVQYVIVPADSDIAAPEDLQGKKIGVQLGTTGDFIATDDIADAEVSRYDKPVDAVNDLINGRVELVIIDKNTAQVFEENFAGQVKALPGDQFNFGEEYYAIAVPKDSALLESINTALAELIEDGTFDALVAEYIGG